MAKVNLFELGKKLSVQKEDLSNINSMLIFEFDSSKEYITNDYFNSNETESSKSFNLGIKYNIYSKQNNKQNFNNYSEKNLVFISKKVKNYCQVYKLKKSELDIDLFRICLSNIKSGQTSLVIVVDLGRLEILIECLVDFVDKLRTILNEYDAKKFNLAKNYEEMVSAFKKSNDTLNIREFPVPLMIVGSNLINFLKLDDQDRQSVQQFLRHFCLINFAQLYFLNEQSEYSIHRCKLLVNHLAFEPNLNETLKFNQMDKSLLVLFGQDKLELIYTKNDKIEWNDALQAFKNKFKQKKIEPKNLDKIKIDLFSEPDIDLILGFNFEKLEFKQFHDT